MTVMSSSRLKNWKIIPTWRRRYCATPVSLSVSTRSPPTVMAPLVGRSSPAIRLSSVDFPLPEGPMIATDSPRETSILTCATAGDPSLSYCLLTLMSCTKVSMPARYGRAHGRRVGRRRQLAYRGRLKQTVPSSLRCTDLRRANDGFPAGCGDNGHVAQSSRGPMPAGRAARLTARMRSAARRPVLFGVSNVGDLALAAAVTIAAVVTAVMGLLYVAPAGPSMLHLLAVPSWALVGVLATTAPLAFRRTWPTGAFAVILVALIVTSSYATAITVGAAIFAAYSAVAYSKYRRTTRLALLAGAVIISVAYPEATAQVAARFTPVLVLMPTVAVASMMRMWRERAADSAERLRLSQAEHEAEKRRAVALERARIASELHDVVTHNVSVMVVQAGAARRVLEGTPGEAPTP